MRKFAVKTYIIPINYILKNNGNIQHLLKKEKKEVLDAGLEKTKTGIFDKITRAIAGKSKVDDEVLDNLEDVLLTSDVGVDTTVEIIHKIEERVARDKYVGTAELNKILKEEITALLTRSGNDDAEDFEIPPAGGRMSSWWWV